MTEKIVKRMISFGLCLVLICSLVSGLRVSASGLEAYDLTWGIVLEYGVDDVEIEVARPGAYCFSGTPGRNYVVECYRVGAEDEPLASVGECIWMHNRISNTPLAFMELENGDYYFVVTPVAEDYVTPMGSSVTSPIWTYIRPDAKMPTATDLSWNWPYGNFSPIDPVAGETIIEGEYLFAGEPEDTPISIGGFTHWDTGRASQMEMDGSCVQAHGPGYYFFRIRALSPNVELYCHGDWSELSSPYYCESGTIEYPTEEEPAPDRGDSPFVDVFVGDYFYEPVLWAVDRAVTTGMDAEHFAPGEICTRGQIVTFLWRSYGCPAPASDLNPFTDVTTEDYFYNAVLWAVEKGITAGTSATTFSPEAPCTRGQVATFLWRAKGEPAIGGNTTAEEDLAALEKEYGQKKAALEGYYDAEISVNEAVCSDLMAELGISYLYDKTYYQTEIYTAQQDLISLNTKYHYTTSALEKSRLQKEIAALQEELVELNLCVSACDARENVESLTAEKRRALSTLDSWYAEEKQKLADSPKDPAPLDNPFYDVAQDAYYFEPVLWAVDMGITNGMGDGSFAPDSPCTRGQIVTFLWRSADIPEQEPENTPENPPENQPENDPEDNPGVDSNGCGVIPAEELPVRVSWKTMNYLLKPAGYETKTTVEIQDLTPEFSENSDGTVDLELKVHLKVTYLKQGWDNVGYGVRLYNANGTMVGSKEGTIISAATGLVTTDTVNFRDLEPGIYTVEFVDTFD